MADDDPDVGSAIKSKSLAKILEEENLGKWDSDTVNLDSVANLPSWCKEWDKTNSPDSFERTLNKWNFVDRIRDRLKRIKAPFVKKKRLADRTSELQRRSKLAKPEVVQRLPEPPPKPTPTQYIDVYYSV